jgi:hypothetical protein
MSTHPGEKKKKQKQKGKKEEKQVAENEGESLMIAPSYGFISQVSFHVACTSAISSLRN